MHGGFAARVERNAEHAAAVLFGAAAGYAVFRLIGSPAPQALGLAAAAAVVCGLLCSRTLLSLAADAGLIIPPFELREFEFEPDELLLTDAERVAPSPEEPLELDDVLAEMGPDSRVVRLFDRQAMPTPGQLKERIDDHLRQPQDMPPPDASQALLDALAELRRALR